VYCGVFQEGKESGWFLIRLMKLMQMPDKVAEMDPKSISTLVFACSDYGHDSSVPYPSCDPSLSGISETISLVETLSLEVSFKTYNTFT